MSQSGETGMIDIAETEARIAKLMAETAKLNSETRYYPIVVGSGLTLAIVAIVKVFLA